MKAAVLALALVACGDNGAVVKDAGPDACIDCAHACVDPATDCPAPPPCTIQTCSDNVCTPVVDPAQEGNACGTDQICIAGSCGATVCGNGIVELGEDCDFGTANGPNAGCEADCTLSCVTSPDSCDDHDPCNGTESCSAVTVSGHVGQHCTTTAALDDGTACGAGHICLTNACTAGVCGDSFVTAPEECDDANSTAGDGCENDCRFSCVSTDATRDCTPADACAGQGTCDDGTHTCSPGTPLADNTACAGGYCRGGACAAPACGDGIVTPNEACDDGPDNGSFGDGCNADCTFACVNPAIDCGPPPACEVETCTAGHTCHAVPDAALNGTACGGTYVCNNGSCADPAAVCGNGIVEPGEQCDFGAGNGPGTGCEINCVFTCTTAPNSCDDQHPCNGVETCGIVMVGGQLGQKCSPGTPETDGTPCGGGRICHTQVCTASTCGDGYIDTARGETCEPPNTMTCDTVCHVVVCGDGVRAGTEQCDDGNTANLDGCNANCRFEQIQRFTSMSVPLTHDSFCTANALGEALYSVSDSEINAALTSGIADGSITIMFDALGLDDLTGTSEPAFSMGALGGTPTTGPSTYDGSSDLDWWYTTDPTTIDATRTPTTIVPASINAKVLTAGPGRIAFKMGFDGVAVTVDELDTRFRANIGATSQPTASTGATPGHLASEHVDPALTSFATMSAGELCANMTTRSLYNTQVPSALVGNMCSQNYTTSNTLLDVYISGCHYIIVNLVTPTQPDASRTPGDVYRFTANASHVVTSCTKNGVADTLDDCLDNAAYSMFVKFTSDRVIGR